MEVVTDPTSTPNPSWLGFVRTGRARPEFGITLKPWRTASLLDLGLKLLAQALRAEGIEKLPDDPTRYQVLWEKLFRFTGNKNRADLLVDVGLGERIASIVAKRIAALLSEMGEKPDPLLMTRERFIANDNLSQGTVLLDGTENAPSSIQLAAALCLAITFSGYLGRGEGLAVHTADCSVGLKLQQKDSERFSSGVDWSDEPLRNFEARHSRHGGQHQRCIGQSGWHTGRLRGRHRARGDGPSQCARCGRKHLHHFCAPDLSHLETVLKKFKTYTCRFECRAHHPPCSWASLPPKNQERLNACVASDDGLRDKSPIKPQSRAILAG
jgi:hypothetical protein